MLVGIGGARSCLQAMMCITSLNKFPKSRMGVSLGDGVAVYFPDLPEVDSSEEYELPEGAGKDHFRGRGRVIDIEYFLELDERGLSQAQIAKLLGCSRNTVNRRLNKADLAGLRRFKKHEPDVLAHQRRRIVEKITDKNLKDAGLREKVSSYQMLLNSERLLTDKSTSNVHTVHSDVAKLKELMDAGTKGD